MFLWNTLENKNALVHSLILKVAKLEVKYKNFIVVKSKNDGKTLQKLL